MNQTPDLLIKKYHYQNTQPIDFNIFLTYIYESDLYRLNFELLSAVWKIYVEFGWQKDEQRRQAFTTIENKLRRYHEDNEDSLTESLMQKDVTSALTRILNRASNLAMQEEYSVGPYRCDIAFPELKIAIEINGPCHYRDALLRRTDQFRNYLIHRRTGFEILIIPYQEIDACHKDGHRLEQYLKIKLSAHSELFKPEQRKYQPPHFRQQQRYAAVEPLAVNKPGAYVLPALRSNSTSSGSVSANTNSRTRLSW